MLQKYILRQGDSLKVILKILSLALVCLITVGLFFCITSAAICHIDFSYETIPAIIAAILGISSAVSGFVTSRLMKENGLIWGIISGVIILTVLCIFSICCGTFALSADFITKTLILIISGSIGGIIGVNVS